MSVLVVKGGVKVGRWVSAWWSRCEVELKR